MQEIVLLKFSLIFYTIFIIVMLHFLIHFKLRCKQLIKEIEKRNKYIEQINSEIAEILKANKIV